MTSIRLRLVPPDLVRTVKVVIRGCLWVLGMSLAATAGVMLWQNHMMGGLRDRADRALDLAKYEDYEALSK
jgi:predicted outer membrane lipoprotein